MNYKNLWFFATVFVLSTSIAFLLCYVAMLYKKDISLSNANPSQRMITRTLTIESVDVSSRVIVGKPHLDIGPYERIRFTLPASLNVFRQETISENGIVVGFEAPYVIPFSSLQPGMTILVSLDTSSGKTLVATGMLINDLFARE